MTSFSISGVGASMRQTSVISSTLLIMRPMRQDFPRGCDEPLAVMHPSCSIGYPKPIIWTHGFCASHATSLLSQALLKGVNKIIPYAIKPNRRGYCEGFGDIVFVNRERI
ncbi:hypothetical protein ACMFMF_011931 [Clarireedia jacksonii]